MGTPCVTPCGSRDSRGGRHGSDMYLIQKHLQAWACLEDGAVCDLPKEQEVPPACWIHGRSSSGAALPCSGRLPVVIRGEQPLP